MIAVVDLFLLTIRSILPTVVRMRCEFYGPWSMVRFYR
jgi:hypothetical protein